MLKVGFVVTPQFPIMSLAALSVFEFANLHTGRALYETRLLSEHGGPVPAAMGAHLQTQVFAGSRCDTVIIGGNTEIVPTTPALLAFLTAAAGTSRRICSICTGVFALADAGLLDGRRVTTHWLFTEALKSRFPSLRLEADRLFIKDGAIWTAAGNSAGVDLALSLLEGDHGSELALAVARILVIDYQRAGGQSQHSELRELNPKSDRIQQALNYGRAHLRADLSVEKLSQAAGLSPRQFSRAFRVETGESPAKAIERLRVEAAQLMLEQSRHPIEIIAAETGFGDQERMRRAFMRVFGHPPQTIRRAKQNGVEAG